MPVVGERTKSLYSRIDSKGNVIQTPAQYRQYLLILYYYDNNNTFEFITGEEDVCEWLGENIDDIDINKSLVISETHTIRTAPTLKDFITYASDWKAVLGKPYIEIFKNKLSEESEDTQLSTPESRVTND